jgi:hypothetical protein
MPKRLEVIGGTETKIFCHTTVCQMHVLAVPRTVEMGLTKVGNRGKLLNHFEKLYLL